MFNMKSVFSVLLVPTAAVCAAGNPRSLSHLSRVETRRHVSCSRLRSMELPNRLRNYLLYKDNDLYAKIICREDN